MTVEEAGGTVAAAGAGAILIGLGHGMKWLLGWGERRAESRAAKLQLWHEELSEREKAFDVRVEGRLKTLEERDRLREAENMALRLAFELVASALRSIDPRNTALSRAEQMLQAAFPLAPIVPPDMTASLQVIAVEDGQ
jgi:hypothetical protein